MTRSLAIPFLAGLALLAFTGATKAQSSSLQQVDSLLAAGATRAARTDLDRIWADAGRERLTAERRAHALFLRAILAADFEAAEGDLLDVVLGHPTTPQAPDALLRLGQGLLASGQAARAAEYLQRLIRDYPTSPLRPAGALWLARAQRRTSPPREACNTLGEALTSRAGDDEVRALLERERTACAPPTDARFAVQLGAFRDASNAAALARRARAAGVESRVVSIGSGSLRCVRVGRFSSAADAQDALRRLRDAGLGGVVVDDVGEEHPAD